MDSEDLYDEFGNFLGDANDSDAESDFEVNDNSNPKQSPQSPQNTENTENLEDTPMEDVGAADDNEISRKFPAVETVYVDPTEEGRDEPVIMPLETKNLRLEYRNIDNSSLPQTTYNKTYLQQLPSSSPSRLRNVAIVGSLHTGKTSLIDAFITETHPEIRESKQNARENKSLRYLDTHTLENSRGLSLHSSVASLLVQDPRDRSFGINFIDCPGHPDFRDEIYASLSVVEGVVFVVDVVEGLNGPGKRVLDMVMRQNLPIVVVLNKIDRLMLELRLPPRDSMLKIRHVLSEINAHIYHNEYASGYTHEKLISPLKQNVVFASHTFQASFTLASWARLYMETRDLPVDEQTFEKLLWGDIFYENGKFTRQPSKSAGTTTFEHFVLEPLYKLVTHTLVSEAQNSTLSLLLWDQFRISLPKATYKEDPQTLLKAVFHALFPKTADFVHSIVSSVGPPLGKEVLSEKGVDSDQIPDFGVMAEVFKMNLTSDGTGFECFAKIHCGTLNVGDTVKVVASSDTEDTRTEQIKAIFLPVGRYNIEVEQAFAGTIVLLTGLGGCISKNATLYSKNTPSSSLKPVHISTHGKKSFYKVAVECENPAELPRLVAGLQKLTKFYLSALTKLEESGEHVLLAPGELYLDCFLHDLRVSDTKYLSIKVSDPMVKFAETCGERSATKISVSTQSRTHSLSITAEPVGHKRLLSAIETGKVSLAQPKRTTAKILKEEFGWDALAARSVWCFGPQDMQNPSMLLDDTIEGETDKELLTSAKDSIVAGFKLGINEGPLCDEPVRRTKFKILDAVLGGNVQNSGGQVIPMARNAVHCGMLTAAPRLLEPMYRIYVTCTYKSVAAVHTIIEKRRGWAVAEYPVVGTQMYEIEGCVPIIDSVGLDTDMRLYTQGQAFCSLEFFRWDVVPGDPLDQLCVLPPMKPVPRASLARDFVLKTRKRKGLSGEPTLQKYIDPELYTRLKQNGIVN